MKGKKGTGFMIHTSDDTNTFIEVAEDCNAEKGIEPPLKADKKSIARMQYELLKNYPYEFTSDELIFHLHVIRNQIPEEQKDKERERLFSKGQACMRSSSLSKKYGWGIHFDQNSKMAIYGVDSKEYSEFKKNPRIKHKKAMRIIKK